MTASRKARTQPEFDRLDTRTLLSTATLSRGILAINGTDASEAINVFVQRSFPQARGAMALRGTVVVDGVGAFPLARVRRVVINGGAGDDLINVIDNGRVPLPAQVFGGTGHNLINGTWDRPPTPPPTYTPPAATRPVYTPPAYTPPAYTPPAYTPPSGSSTPSPSGASLGLSAAEQRILDLVNMVRTGSGLAPLTLSAKLEQAARIHAQDMARVNLMEHELTGVAQPTLQDRASAVGYNYRWLGENIAYNYSSADAVMGGWMSSPGHKANILDPNYTEIGIAVAYNAAGEPYYEQTFGTPA